MAKFLWRRRVEIGAWLTLGTLWVAVAAVSY